ncbi:hypothetical protein [Microbacterium lacticum]|uniref:hypothetical protein n=1 Tax=Microbacterium lacticum TaxID=33885 RepID=UPI0028D4F4BF|nr:hypothetical protein [Microbacterium lacticum]
MSRVESAEKIEGIVGAKRHAVDHIGRAVTAESRVYILHSERCRAQYADLRECPYSRALDRGIDVRKRWAGFLDRPVRLWVSVATHKLVPEVVLDPGELPPPLGSERRGQDDVDG